LFWQHEHRLLCEFQRRSGCVIFFNKFWRKTLSSLATHSPTFPPSVLPSEISDSDSSSLVIPDGAKCVFDTESVTQLMAMAGSENVDVQREACSAFAMISHAHSFAPALQQLLPILDKLLSDCDDEMCRTISVFVANLSVQEECRCSIVASLLNRLLNTLDEPSRLANRDTKRHIARTLFECSKNDGCRKAMLSRVSVLEGLQGTQDSALQACITGTLRQLF